MGGVANTTKDKEKPKIGMVEAILDKKSQTGTDWMKGPRHCLGRQITQLCEII